MFIANPEYWVAWTRRGLSYYSIFFSQPVVQENTIDTGPELWVCVKNPSGVYVLANIDLPDNPGFPVCVYGQGGLLELYQSGAGGPEAGSGGLILPTPIGQP